MMGIADLATLFRYFHFIFFIIFLIQRNHRYEVWQEWRCPSNELRKLHIRFSNVKHFYYFYFYECCKMQTMQFQCLLPRACADQGGQCFYANTVAS